MNAGRSDLRVRTAFGVVEVKVDPDGGTDLAARETSMRELRTLLYDFKYRSPEARRIVRDLYARLWGGLGAFGGSAVDYDTGSPQADAVGRELEDAVRSGRLQLRRVEARSVVVPLAGEEEEVLGPEPVEEVEPDVYVLAAEVMLIGDTPLINHPVRVLDPDTGDVVVDGLKTDEKGIVRTDVPAKKIYRIEILDRDPDLNVLPTVATKHPVLRCKFVDTVGSPVPDLIVTVKDVDGHGQLSGDYYTDEKGLLEVPAPRLGFYVVLVAEDRYCVHSLLNTDPDDKGYEIVVPYKLDDGGDGVDPNDRLARSWDDDDEDDDDEDDGGDDDDSSGDEDNGAAA